MVGHNRDGSVLMVLADTIFAICVIQFKLMVLSVLVEVHYRLYNHNYFASIGIFINIIYLHDISYTMRHGWKCSQVDFFKLFLILCSVDIIYVMNAWIDKPIQIFVYVEVSFILIKRITAASFVEEQFTAYLAEIVGIIYAIDVTSAESVVDQLD